MTTTLTYASSGQNRTSIELTLLGWPLNASIKHEARLVCMYEVVVFIMSRRQKSNWKEKIKWRCIGCADVVGMSFFSSSYLSPLVDYRMQVKDGSGWGNAKE